MDASINYIHAHPPEIMDQAEQTVNRQIASTKVRLSGYQEIVDDISNIPVNNGKRTVLRSPDSEKSIQRYIRELILDALAFDVSPDADNQTLLATLNQELTTELAQALVVGEEYTPTLHQALHSYANKQITMLRKTVNLLQHEYHEWLHSEREWIDEIAEQLDTYSSTEFFRLSETDLNSYQTRLQSIRETINDKSRNRQDFLHDTREEWGWTPPHTLCGQIYEELEHTYPVLASYGELAIAIRRLLTRTHIIKEQSHRSTGKSATVYS